MTQSNHTDLDGAAENIGPWLRELVTASGMSIRAIAREIDYDRGALTRVFTHGRGLHADTLLKILSAIGARIEPTDLKRPPRAMNAELAELRSLVESRLPPTATDQAIELVRRLDAGEPIPAEDLERLAAEMRQAAQQTARLADRLEEGARSARL